MAYFLPFLCFKQHKPPASEKNRGFVDDLTHPHDFVGWVYVFVSDWIRGLASGIRPAI